MTETAAISIVLVTHQSQRFIDDCVNSILNQSFTRFELLIWDNASTDGTRLELAEFAKKDSRIKLHLAERNEGVGKALEQLFQKSFGAFIAQIGHDDIWLPEHLETLYQKMADSEASVAFSGVSLIDEKGTSLDTVKSPFRHELVKTLSTPELLNQLLSKNFFCAPASLIRKSHLSRFKRISENDQLQDWEYWLYLLVDEPFVLTNLVSVKYRIHPGNLSGNGGSLVMTEIDRNHTLFRFLDSALFQSFFLTLEPLEQSRLVSKIMFMAVDNDKLRPFVLLAFRQLECLRAAPLPELKEAVSVLYYLSGALRKSVFRNLTAIPGDLLKKLGTATVIVFKDQEADVPLPGVKRYRFCGLSFYRLKTPERRFWVWFSILKNGVPLLTLLERAHYDAVTYESSWAAFQDKVLIRLRTFGLKS